MTLSITLGGTALALPERDNPFNITDNPIGASLRTASGAYRQDYVTVKKTVTVNWTNLTSAERATIRGKWLAALSAAATLVLPDAQSFSVFSALSGWNESHWYRLEDEAARYDISATFEEA